MKVYAVRCPSYDQVEEKTRELLSLMGGMGRFAKPGERIILKANLLIGSPPEKAITTHPAVVAALGQMVKAEGATPTIADSPAAGLAHDERGLRRTYRECGMTEVAEQAGLEIGLDTRFEAVSFPDGELIKRFEIMSPILEADGVLNLCKLKTHTYTGMTGAIKNLFGVVPGRAKTAYHATLDDPARFAQMLLDLAACVPPRLSIMDAVVGMEGDGPCAGTPRDVGFLLAAVNPLALDVVAGEIIGLPRKLNVLLVEAEKRGLSPTRIEEIEVIGVDVADLRIDDFKFPVTLVGGGGWDRGAGMTWWQLALVPLLVPVLKKWMVAKPRVTVSRCIACGVCRNACPANAIAMIGQGRDRYANIDERECIRCYCCHEMCTEHAIKLEKSALYQWLGL